MVKTLPFVGLNATHVLAAFSLIALSGCGMTMKMERSPNYELGYSDGCNTAAVERSGVAMTPNRNAALYASDADYRQGWNSGHAQCRMPSPNGL